MFFAEEPVQVGFTSNEIQELLAVFQSGDLVSPNSSSEGWNRSVYAVCERKKRRMISNRESARRSRWRKKKHLENLKEQANRLSMENMELKNQLALVINQCNVVRRENHRLRSESVALRARLLDLYRILVAMQSH